MPIYKYEDKIPVIDPSAWIAPSACLIGDVRIGPEVYVGWQAVLRGDHGAIEVHRGSAVEEGVIIHTTQGFFSRIGDEVTLGHGAMLHDAIVEDMAVIGMRATISNNAVVGRWSIIGEMGLVSAGQTIPPESIAVGIPVQIIGPVQDRHKERWSQGKKRYQEFTRRNPKELHLLSLE
ncbi:MAG: gamma carbonic anhydrase family protein [Desulfarculaceae bacterium]|jgi:phenylacetic acid degradation protein